MLAGLADSLCVKQSQCLLRIKQTNLLRWFQRIIKESTKSVLFNMLRWRNRQTQQTLAKQICIIKVMSAQEETLGVEAGYLGEGISLINDNNAELNSHCDKCVETIYLQPKHFMCMVKTQSRKKQNFLKICRAVTPMWVRVPFGVQNA